MELELEKLSITPSKIINIVFAGHVDAGKSTICGRMLVDLGLVDPRTLEKYKKQAEDANRASWYLSWCVDLNPEEREKGKTTEYCSYSLNLAHTRINVFDTPGHKKFIEQMIEGTSRADVGILIISARKSEFEAGMNGGQTKEHIYLLKLGNIDHLVVLVNKMDECDWSQERFEEIKTKVNKFTKGWYEKVFFIPVSGFEGDNIKDRRKTQYYDGPSFIEYLDTIEVKEKDSEPCMTVVEKVKSSSSSYFYAKMDAGIFQKNLECKILPYYRNDKITSIANKDDVELSATETGDTYKIKLRDFNDDLCVGNKIVSLNNNNWGVANEIIAEVMILEVNKAVTIGYSAVIHLSNQSSLIKILDLVSMEKKKIKIARKRERVIAKIKLESPLILSNKPENQNVFAIRDESLTIAFGKVKKFY